MSLLRNLLPRMRPGLRANPYLPWVNHLHRSFSTVGKSQATPAENTASETIEHRPELLYSLLQGHYVPPSTGDQIPDMYSHHHPSQAKQTVDPTPMMLREACTCSRCVDPSDHQRHFVFADIPTDISIAGCTVDSKGNYSITWENDIPGYSDHVSRYTKTEIEQIHSQHTLPVTEFGKRPKQLWNALNYDMAANTVSYQDYMNNDAALARLLDLVSKYGLAFIDGIPGKADSVNKMAERVGPLRTTFYGETWDVKSMPDATNVAYTSRELSFHMDMLYVREPPGLQFLHCIENTCEGGESRFADTYQAADRLVSQAGKPVFDALESMKIKYHYFRPGNSTSAIKPVFDTQGHESKPLNNFTNAANPDLINRLHRIYWSPPFTGRAIGNDLSSDRTLDVPAQLRASQQFHTLLNSPSSVIETKVPAGTCAVFDNFRVVHARRAFDLNGGNRWLRVSYVDDADFQSRALTLRELMP